MTSKSPLILSLVALMLSSCSTYHPTKIDDICKIFWGETDWYEDASAAHNLWGTPITVMMALMKHASSVRADVRPDRPRFLFLPLPRRSSAYG